MKLKGKLICACIAAIVFGSFSINVGCVEAAKTKVSGLKKATKEKRNNSKKAKRKQITRGTKKFDATQASDNIDNISDVCSAGDASNNSEFNFEGLDFLLGRSVDSLNLNSNDVDLYIYTKDALTTLYLKIIRLKNPTESDLELKQKVVDELVRREKLELMHKNNSAHMNKPLFSIEAVVDNMGACVRFSQPLIRSRFPNLKNYKKFGLKLVDSANRQFIIHNIEPNIGTFDGDSATIFIFAPCNPSADFLYNGRKSKVKISFDEGFKLAAGKKYNIILTDIFGNELVKSSQVVGKGQYTTGNDERNFAWCFDEDYYREFLMNNGANELFF